MSFKTFGTRDWKLFFNLLRGGNRLLSVFILWYTIQNFHSVIHSVLHESMTHEMKKKKIKNINLTRKQANGT